MVVDMLKIVFVLVFATLQTVAYGGEETSQIVGKSLCELGINKAAGYGISLDRKKHLNLEVKKTGTSRLLMIVEYSDVGNKCGIVRDIVYASSLEHSFEFNCLDAKHRSDIVIGEFQTNDLYRPWKQQKTKQGWRVDLDTLKMTSISTPVVCYNTSYSGADDGDDLSMWAQKRK